MCSAIRDLTASPVFEVVVNGEISMQKKQASGIRQGCTLSPLLFIALQIVMFHDIEREFLGKYPLTITPIVPFFNVEFADNVFFIWFRGKRRNTIYPSTLVNVSLFSTIRGLPFSSLMGRTRISTKRKIDIYCACVVSKLMYRLCIFCLTEKEQVRC